MKQGKLKLQKQQAGNIFRISGGKG